MDDLNKMAPKLSKMKKENPYRTPDNYFDDLSARLQIKIEATKQPHPEKQNKVIKLLKPIIGLAASFALIFMLVYWPLNKFMTNEVAENVVEETVITEDIYSSIIENIDEETFYSLLEQEENTEDFSDDELINYISANVSDYEIYLETEY